MESGRRRQILCEQPRRWKTQNTDAELVAFLTTPPLQQEKDQSKELLEAGRGLSQCRQSSLEPARSCPSIALPPWSHILLRSRCLSPEDLPDSPTRLPPSRQATLTLLNSEPRTRAGEAPTWSLTGGLPAGAAEGVNGIDRTRCEQCIDRRQKGWTITVPAQPQCHKGHC